MINNKFLNNIKKLEKNINKLVDSQFITYGFKLSLKKTLKEIKLYKNYISGLKKLNKIDNLNTVKIQIGGGKHILKGYLNVDIISPADFIWDVREGLPFNDKCSEFIFTEHFLEHIDYPVSVKKFIKECYRILKKKGKLVIGVPNGEFVIKNYFEKNKKFFLLMKERWYSKRKNLELNTYIDLVNYNFRDQDDDSKYNPHYWAYDFEKLKSLLENAGFVKIKKWKFDSTIANPKREWGAIYVKAIK